MIEPLHVFCCYAREDKPYLRKLKNNLMPLQRDGLITVQADIDVSPGEEWEQKISHYLNTAQMILLLISSDFMASDYCYSIEMMRAMERHENGEARVIPIILRPSDWELSPISALQALPEDAVPISDKRRWHTRDEAFLNVTKGIKKAIEDLMIQLQPRKIALFGYETQGGSASTLWTGPDTFSLNQNAAYLKWLRTKRTFTVDEILNRTWIKAGNHGYCFTLHFLPPSEARRGQLVEGSFVESPLMYSTQQVSGSWRLIDGVLRMNIEQYENGTLVKYELDLIANKNGLMHSGIESRNNMRTPHAYFVFLSSQPHSANRLEEALAAYNQLISVDRNCAEAYKTKGYILRDLGRFQEALGAYQQAVTLKPDYMWAWYDIGDMLHKLDRLEEALLAFDRALALDDNQPWIWFEKGQTLRDLKHYTKALAAYDRAIQIDPNTAWFWHQRGETLRKLGQYQEALGSYERALELGSQDASILTRKGQVLRALKRYEEALTAYDQAIRLESDYIDAYLGKGRVYLDLGRYNDALDVYEQATKVAPNNTWTWHDKGQALGYLQRAEEALQAFEHALELDPDNRWAWLHKAEVLTYLAQQAYKEAGQLGKEPLKRQYYNLIQEATGKCLDGNGDTVYMHNPNGGDFQLWKAIEVTPDTIVLKHFWSGKVLEATNERGAYFNRHTSSPSQQWRLEDGDDGYKKLKHVATDLVLHGDTNNDVYLQPDNGSGFQAWKAVRIHITSFTTPDEPNVAELKFDQ